jgi:hypothetical protein
VALDKESINWNRPAVLAAKFAISLAQAIRGGTRADFADFRRMKLRNLDGCLNGQHWCGVSSCLEVSQYT